MLATVIYRFAEFELDLTRVELRAQGAVRALEPQVFALLALLIETGRPATDERPVGEERDPRGVRRPVEHDEARRRRRPGHAHELVRNGPFADDRDLERPREGRLRHGERPAGEPGVLSGHRAAGREHLRRRRTVPW